MFKFCYFNPHPGGTSTEVDDCVKRSIVAVTTGMDYMTVQRELNAYKKVTGAKSFNSGRNPYSYVEDVLGAKKVTVSSNTTVEQFCNSHPCGRYILDIDEHWSACVNGCIYDTWNCGGEKVNFAYEITTRPYTPPDLKKQVFKYCCTSEKISDMETRIRIYDGNGHFVERVIPTEMTAGYVLCLQHSHYRYIDLDKGETNEG